MKNKDNLSTSNTETDDVLRAENEKLKAENTKLKQQNNWLLERLKLNSKKMFSSSSEKTEQENSDQLVIDAVFNEAEQKSDLSVPEPEITEVKAHRRKVSKMEDRVPEDLPIEIVEQELPEDEQTCPQCGEKLHVLGKETVREELKIIPAKAVIVRHVRYTYACRNCEKNDITVPIIKAPVPNAVIKGGFASPESVAYIMSQKYVLDVPLNRQEADFKRRDILLSRQTMCNWLMKASEDWLKPIYEKLHKEFLSCDVAHADETTIQVLKEPDKKAQAKSYMWLYRTGSYAKHQVALYDYQQTRSAKHALTFLEGFTGYLHCDGYQAYKKLPEDVKLVGCWAHARRKFDEALNCLDESQRKDSKAQIGFNYCQKLFAIERQIKDLSPEERFNKRQELAKTVLDEFLSWLNSCNAAPKSHFGRAVDYTLRQWPYLQNYLMDGRTEISNNQAEHLAKSFAVCRKNFLFSNTPRGATSSAIILSVISTAMLNGRDPYKYLTFVFREAPNVDLNNADELTRLMPWNAPGNTKLVAN